MNRMSPLICITCVLVLSVGVRCASNDSLNENFFKILYNHTDTKSGLEGNLMPPDAVTYYLYSKNSRNKYVQLYQRNLNLLANQKIVFFIHGWFSNKDIAKWYKYLTLAFLKNYKDYFIVQMDWRILANQLYHMSVKNIEYVGKILADLILNLNANHSVNLSDIILIGHSLGAQISGFAGKNIYNATKQKMPRIIALDPAGPLFSKRPEDMKLNKNDAEVVQVIHTAGGNLGYFDAIGTIDFFPNGGKFQPGCKKMDTNDLTTTLNPFVCDHMRATEYFREAILFPTSLGAKKCSDWDSYKAGNCENEEEVTMGNLTTTATGNFYLETNDKIPYSKTGLSVPK